MPNSPGPNLSVKSKRRRLNFACNYCRSRKTRCDEQQPSCQACILAGVPCVTEDRRRPGKLIHRREAGKIAETSSVSSMSPLEGRLGGTHGSEDGAPTHPSAEPCSAPSSIVAATQEDISSQVRPHDKEETIKTHKITSPLPIWRQTFGATSFNMLTEWLDLGLHRLDIPYRFGITPTPGTPVSSSCSYFLEQGLMSQRLPRGLPAIPDAAIAQTLLDVYRRDIHDFFPVLQWDKARADALQICKLQSTEHSPCPSDVSLLRTYLLLSVGGSIMHQKEWKVFIEETLVFARGALGYLIGVMTADTLEAIFLLSICLRLNDEIASAWTTLGLCVSLASCMGLDRASSGQECQSYGLHDHRRHPKWWAIYSYEKLFSFQLGYVSCITDNGYDSLDFGLLKSKGLKSHDIVVTLAKVLSDVSRRCVKARQQEDLASIANLEAAINEKVNATGESGLLLVKWADSLPSNLRPASDIMQYSEESHLASFISLHFSNAIIMLFRNSLLISKDALHKAVEVIAKGKPWEHIVRNGQSMTVSSARRIVHILAQTEESHLPPLAPAYYASLHAFYILAIQVSKQPGQRISRLDTSLMANAADLARSAAATFRERNRLDIVLSKVEHLVREATKLALQAKENQQTYHESVLNADMMQARHDPQVLPQSSVISQSAVSFSNQPNYPLNAFDQTLGNLPGDQYPSPVLPDEIGCDWADFENFLLGLGNDYDPRLISDAQSEDGLE